MLVGSSRPADFSRISQHGAAVKVLILEEVKACVLLRVLLNVYGLSRRVLFDVSTHHTQ